MAPDETDRLFVVPPAGFVAARRALASALKAAGRREEAAVVEKRPRPSVSTWATNQVARSAPALIRELGEVTARLQAGGGPDYAEAIAQHRAVLKTLRAKAEEALLGAGLRAALPALAQVLQNLRAGMANAQTRAVVEAGRLIQDLATIEEGSLFDGATATWAGRGPAPSAPAEVDASGDRDREQREAESLRERGARASGTKGDAATGGDAPSVQRRSGGGCLRLGGGRARRGLCRPRQGRAGSRPPRARRRYRRRRPSVRRARRSNRRRPSSAARGSESGRARLTGRPPVSTFRFSRALP